MNCWAYLRNSSDLLASARETTPTVKITSLLRVPRPNELLTFLYWLEGVSAASCCCCCDVWAEVLLEAEDLDGAEVAVVAADWTGYSSVHC